jgi:hypothetical protein
LLNLYLMMVEIKETVLEDGTVRREIPTEYRCYYCNGVINKVEYYRYKIKMFHRWTYSSCQTDYDTGLQASFKPFLFFIFINRLSLY